MDTRASRCAMWKLHAPPSRYKEFNPAKERTAKLTPNRVTFLNGPNRDFLKRRRHWPTTDSGLPNRWRAIPAEKAWRAHASSREINQMRKTALAKTVDPQEALEAAQMRDLIVSIVMTEFVGDLGAGIWLAAAQREPRNGSWKPSCATGRCRIPERQKREREACLGSSSRETRPATPRREGPV
jgi:hypothetical protein